MEDFIDDSTSWWYWWFIPSESRRN